jgi:hypothetical protein
MGQPPTVDVEFQNAEEISDSHTMGSVRTDVAATRVR